MKNRLFSVKEAKFFVKVSNNRTMIKNILFFAENIIFKSFYL